MDKVRLTKEQTKVFDEIQRNDCIVETGRRWGKSFLIKALTSLVSLNNDVLIIVPIPTIADMTLESLRESLKGIWSINKRKRQIQLYNRHNIRILSTESITTIDRDLFEDYQYFLFDEYGFFNPHHLKKALRLLPADSHKCFITTPSEGASTYIIRKWIFSMYSFHFFRFSTPGDIYPHELNLDQPFVQQELYAKVPLDPLTDYIIQIEESVKTLRCNVTNVNQLKSIENIEKTLERIKDYCL